jgi:hypothetical protein
LSVLKDLTDQAEKVRSNILTAGEVAVADHQQTPLTEHFDAYLNKLESADTSKEHRKNVRRSLRRVAADCGFARLVNLNRDAFERWLVVKARENMAARTRNLCRSAWVAFCN